MSHPVCITHAAPIARYVDNPATAHAVSTAANPNSHHPSPLLRYADPAPAIITALNRCRCGSGTAALIAMYTAATTSGATPSTHPSIEPPIDRTVGDPAMLDDWHERHSSTDSRQPAKTSS